MEKKYQRKSNSSNGLKMLSVGLVALVLVFGVAPLVGEEIQASILTKNSDVAFPVDSKDAATQLGDFVDRCERLGLEECSKVGRAALANVGTSTFEEILETHERLTQSYGKDLAQAACRFDLRAILFRARGLQVELDEYQKNYSKRFPNLPIAQLEAALESCS